MAGFRAGYNLYPSPIFQTYLVQKHSETTLNTQKNDGTKSSFPIKVHAIPGKTPAICKFLVVQMWCKIQKKNRKSLKIKDLRFKMYSEDYLFSNQFMEDLGRIYRLRKVIPDPEMYSSR